MKNEDFRMRYTIATDEIRHMKKLNIILQDHILLEKKAHIEEVIKLEERIRVLEGEEGEGE